MVAVAEPETAEPQAADAEEANSATGAVTAKAEQQQLSLLPQIDGKTRTQLRLVLSGSVDLEAHDDRDVRLAELLEIDSNVALSLGGVMLEGRVVGKADKSKRDQVGYTEEIRHTITIKIDSLTHPAAEKDAAHNKGK